MERCRTRTSDDVSVGANAARHDVAAIRKAGQLVMTTILFAGGGTGGHVFPMIAVADAVRALAPGVELVFVGTERGLELKVVPAHGFALETMRIAPLRGDGVRGAARGAWLAARAVFAARALVRRHAPAAVLSIGGYAAGPLSLAARSLGV